MENQNDPNATSEGIEEQIIQGRAGPVIRLATVCESIIEEVGTSATTVVRMIDSVLFSLDEIAGGETFLPGWLAFMGHDFPGDADQVEVIILIATDEQEVVGLTTRKMSIQGPNRSFAIANQLGTVRVPRPGQYLLALAYQNQELARAHLTVHFAEPDETTDEDDTR